LKVDFARRVFEPSPNVTLRITGLGSVDLCRSGINMAVVWMVPKKLVTKTSRGTGPGRAIRRLGFGELADPHVVHEDVELAFSCVVASATASMLND
jgi:hypothetical protein